MASRIVDSLITFRILSLLATPFENTDAFKLGIIDENGVALKKSRDLKTPEEKDAYSLLIRMVFNLKRLIQKVPSGARSIATYAAALALIKEQYDISSRDINFIIEDVNKLTGLEMLEEDLQDVNSCDIIEEITNTASSGNVAGFDEPPKPNAKFRGCPVFDVDSKTFRCDTFEKKKGKHIKKYLGLNKEDLDGMGEAIRQYATKNPKESIIIRDRSTGAMRFIKHGV